MAIHRLPDRPDPSAVRLEAGAPLHRSALATTRYVADHGVRALRSGQEDSGSQPRLPRQRGRPDPLRDVRRDPPDVQVADDPQRLGSAHSPQPLHQRDPGDGRIRVGGGPLRAVARAEPSRRERLRLRRHERLGGQSHHALGARPGVPHAGELPAREPVSAGVASAGRAGDRHSAGRDVRVVPDIRTRLRQHRARAQRPGGPPHVSHHRAVDHREPDHDARAPGRPEFRAAGSRSVCRGRLRDGHHDVRQRVQPRKRGPRVSGPVEGAGRLRS